MAKKKDLKLMAGLLGGGVVLLLIAVLVNRQLVKPKPIEPLPVAGEENASPTVEEPTPKSPRCSTLHYTSLLKTAAERYRVPEPTVEEMRRPLPGGTEFRGAKVLKGKKAGMETAHLRLRTDVEKLEASSAYGVIRADHLVLSITNKSDVPLAYRVVTQIGSPEKCGLKAPLAHNAITLLPKQTIRRTECFFHAKQALVVLQVDVYELTPMGRAFLSRVGPVDGGPFDMRVAQGHDFGGFPNCRSLPWRDLDLSTDVWRLVIDFHARHECDEYSLPKGYQVFTEARPLPVCS